MYQTFLRIIRQFMEDWIGIERSTRKWQRYHLLLRKIKN
jgi:hypothetical protein